MPIRQCCEQCAARDDHSSPPLVDRTEFCSSKAMTSDSRYRTLRPIFTKPISRPATLAFRKVFGETCHRAANCWSVRNVSSRRRMGRFRLVVTPDLTALVAHRSSASKRRGHGAFNPAAALSGALSSRRLRSAGNGVSSSFLDRTVIL